MIAMGKLRDQLTDVKMLAIQDDRSNGDRREQSYRQRNPSRQHSRPLVEAQCPAPPVAHKGKALRTLEDVIFDAQHATA